MHQLFSPILNKMIDEATELQAITYLAFNENEDSSAPIRCSTNPTVTPIKTNRLM